MTKLTKGEERIIPLLELSNKKIGEKLFISEMTVKTHIGNLYKKYKVHNRIDLINKIKAERGEKLYLSISQLCRITKLDNTAMRTILSRSEFDEYEIRVPQKPGACIKYLITQEFIQKLYNLMIIKRLIMNSTFLKTYWEINNPFKPLDKNCRDSQLIDANRKLKEIRNICNELADSLPVAEFQDRIKYVLDKV